MGKASQNATLADVAKQAGVSLSTASKALGGRPHVSSETRQKVLSAAEALSFTPATLARALFTGSTGRVGLITHDLEGRFSIPVLLGAEDTFGADQISIFLADARGDALRERYQIAALLRQRVDGLIIVMSRNDVRPSLGQLPVPVVYAYAPSDDETDLAVTTDSVGAGRLAVDHLADLGRRNIAIIQGDHGYGAATDRADGALAALAERGLPLAGGDVKFGAWSEEWGRRATRQLLADGVRPDGIVCGSDQIARGVLDSLREQSIQVPKDVSVIGHDNWEVFDSGARPLLTSIDMNLEEIGRRAAARLVDAIGGNPTPGIETLPVRLIVRDSTDPAE